MVCYFPKANESRKECSGKQCPYYWENELNPCTYGNKARQERKNAIHR
jgi:hypothetical protein